MYKLKFTETAVNNLKMFNKAEQQMIAEKLVYLAENFELLNKSKKVTKLKGTGYNHYRFVIARRIRAIFEIKDGNYLGFKEKVNIKTYINELIQVVMILLNNAVDAHLERETKDPKIHTDMIVSFDKEESEKVKSFYFRRNRH
jgi:mRNA interferase RelE/StbE